MPRKFSHVLELNAVYVYRLSTTRNLRNLTWVGQVLLTLFKENDKKLSKMLKKNHDHANHIICKTNHEHHWTFVSTTKALKIMVKLQLGSSVYVYAPTVYREGHLLAINEIMIRTRSKFKQFLMTETERDSLKVKLVEGVAIGPPGGFAQPHRTPQKNNMTKVVRHPTPSKKKKTPQKWIPTKPVLR